jgi:2-polyprenyl-3-methyl-5-hydroxy-6-metoxy-1,4-benzoquinol methylase
MLSEVINNELINFSKNFKSKKILDYGSGDQRYKKLFIEKNNYYSLDVKKSGHLKIKKNTFIIDGSVKKKSSIKNSFFDVIICTEVLEHVIYLDFTIKEIRRILKKNGLIFLTTPFVWPEHEIPYDFRRFTSYGLKKLFLENNFKILKAKKLVSKNNALQSISDSQLNRLLNILSNKKIYNKLILVFIRIYFKFLKILLNFFFKLYIDKRLPNNFYLGNLLILKKTS